MRLKQEHSGLINFNNRTRFNPNDNIIIHNKEEMIWGKQLFDPEKITELERKDGEVIPFEGDSHDLAKAIGAFFFTINYVGGVARFVVSDSLGGIPDVAVTVDKGEYVTDENGLVEMSLERGKYHINFDKENFEHAEFYFEMKEGEDLDREVFMQNDNILAVYGGLDSVTLMDMSGRENHSELSGSYVLSGNGLDNLVSLKLRGNNKYEIKGRFTSVDSEQTIFTKTAPDLDIHTWNGEHEGDMHLLGNVIDGRYYFANFDLFYCKVWNEDELIMDIAQRDEDGWIYDKVSKQGFRIQGSQVGLVKRDEEQYPYNLLEGFDLYDYRVPIGITGQGEFRGTYPAVENGLNCSENLLPFVTPYFIDGKNPRRFVLFTGKDDQRVWNYVKQA